MNNKILKKINNGDSENVLLDTINKVTNFSLDLTTSFLFQEQKSNNIFQKFNNKIENFQNLKIIKKIGEGAFSEVYQAKEQQSKKLYAIRLTKIDNKNYSLTRANREIKIMDQLKLINHHNINHIYKYDIIKDNKTYYLRMILELGVCDLQKILQRRKEKNIFWTEAEILKISEGLISSLKSCSKYGISHRDISLNNIILSSCMEEYKLIDFGEGSHFIQNIEELPIVGKFYYMAPEVFNLVKNFNNLERNNELKYDAEKADVFSLGVVILNLCLLEEINGSNYDNIIKGLLKIKNKYFRVHSLLENMLNFDFSNRSKFLDLHLFVTNFEKNILNTHLSEVNFINKKDNICLDEKKESKNYNIILEEAEFNKKCKLYKEAINKYIKVYKLLKISHKKNIDPLEFIIITIEIGLCYKNLTNYEIATNIFKSLFIEEIDNLKNEIFLSLKIIFEYSNLLILNSNFKEAHKIITKGINWIKKKNLILPEEKNIFAELFLLKVKILVFLGYILDAKQILLKLENFFKGENYFNFKIIFLAILLKNTEFYEFKRNANLIFKEIDSSKNLASKEILKTEIYILYLEYYYKNKDFNNFSLILEKLSKCFLNYDSIFLVKNKVFLKFVKYQILNLLLTHKYGISLTKVNNIIINLNKEQNKYYYFIFSLLKSEILFKMSKYKECNVNLMDLLCVFGIKEFQNSKLKNYEIFKQIHYQMGLNYYKLFEYNNSLKCFKYILVEYYENKNIFEEKFCDFLLPKIYLMIGKINFKLDKIEKAKKYYDKSEFFLKKIFNDDIYNSNFFRLYLNYFNYYKRIGQKKKSKNYIEMTDLLIKRMYDKKKDSYFNTILIYWYKGKIFRLEKNYDKCLNFLRKSTEMSINLFKKHNKSKIVIITIDMIKICIKFKKFDLAKSYLKNCEKMINNIEDSQIASYHIFFTWGCYEMKKTKYNLAIKNFHKAKKIIVELFKNEICYEATLCDYFIAKCFEKKKNFRDSMQLYEECLNHLLLIFKKKRNKMVFKCKQKLINLKDQNFSPSDFKENIFI